jgi:hypothetical protein
LRRVNINVALTIALNEMIATIKIVAAMTGLALYLAFNKGCCLDDPNCSRGFVRCAWAEIRGVLGLD